MLFRSLLLPSQAAGTVLQVWRDARTSTFPISIREPRLSHGAIGRTPNEKYFIFGAARRPLRNGPAGPMTPTLSVNVNEFEPSPRAQADSHVRIAKEARPKRVRYLILRGRVGIPSARTAGHDRVRVCQLEPWSLDASSSPFCIPSSSLTAVNGFAD